MQRDNAALDAAGGAPCADLELDVTLGHVEQVEPEGVDVAVDAASPIAGRRRPVRKRDRDRLDRLAHLADDDRLQLQPGRIDGPPVELAHLPALDLDALQRPGVRVDPRQPHRVEAHAALLELERQREVAPRSELAVRTPVRAGREPELPRAHDRRREPFDRLARGRIDDGHGRADRRQVVRIVDAAEGELDPGRAGPRTSSRGSSPRTGARRAPVHRASATIATAASASGTRNRFQGDGSTSSASTW